MRPDSDLDPHQIPPPGVPVQPQPTPFAPSIGIGQLADGKNVVVLQLFTVTGSTVLFMPPEGALQFGQDLVARAKEASTGLMIPKSGVILPGQ